MDFVGWYTIGSEPSHEDAQFHQQVSRLSNLIKFYEGDGRGGGGSNSGIAIKGMGGRGMSPLLHRAWSISVKEDGIRNSTLRNALKQYHPM